MRPVAAVTGYRTSTRADDVPTTQGSSGPEDANSDMPRVVPEATFAVVNNSASIRIPTVESNSYLYCRHHAKICQHCGRLRHDKSQIQLVHNFTLTLCYPERWFIRLDYIITNRGSFDERPDRVTPQVPSLGLYFLLSLHLPLQQVSTEQMMAALIASHQAFFRFVALPTFSMERCESLSR